MGSAAEDQRFMRAALAEAERAAAEGEVPIGAVAVRDGRIIASARNRVEASGSAVAHAEFELLRAAAAQLIVYKGDFNFSHRGIPSRVHRIRAASGNRI